MDEYAEASETISQFNLVPASTGASWLDDQTRADCHEKAIILKIFSSGKLGNMVRKIIGVVKRTAGSKSFQTISWRLE